MPQWAEPVSKSIQHLQLTSSVRRNAPQPELVAHVIQPGRHRDAVEHHHAPSQSSTLTTTITTGASGPQNGRSNIAASSVGLSLRRGRVHRPPPRLWVEHVRLLRYPAAISGTVEPPARAGSDTADQQSEQEAEACKESCHGRGSHHGNSQRAHRPTTAGRLRRLPHRHRPVVSASIRAAGREPGHRHDEFFHRGRSVQS